MIKVLLSLPRFDRGGCLFSTTAGAKPINGFSKAKARLDSEIAKNGEVGPWILHDIRRTVRTNLSKLRVEDHIAELIIGHARKGIQGVYDRHDYIDARRDALEAWADRLEWIVHRRANVVALRA